TIDMGDVGFEGGISEAVVFLRNSGAGNLYLPHAPVIEDPNSPFSVIGGGPVLIPPGQGTFIRLRFDPNDEFNGFADDLKIVSNDPTTPVSVCRLTGTGVAGSADGIIPLDRWEGENPVDRVLPFGTTPTNRFTGGEFGAKYEGYVREDNAGEDLVGLMTLNLSVRNGSFSAMATINGVRHSLRGVFSEGNGTTNGTTNRGAAFQLEAHEANTGGNSFKIIGTIDDKKVELVRGSATDNNDPFKDRFSIILPSSDARSVGQPLGDGFGSLTVDHLGNIRGSFVLGDGTRVSHAGLKSVDGEWLFYKDLYRTRPRGFLGGRVVFREVVDISDFDGRFQWVKHADNREKRYPRGFELSQEVLGSEYFVPATGNRAFPELSSGPGNLNVEFTDLSIPDLPGSTEWFDNNRIIYTPVGTERLSMKVNPRTGLISGVYLDRPNRIRLPFGAVIFGRQDLGVGTVLGATETAVITLSPAE
ncbi:MAG: hypothetical protein KDN19_19105, partial [Verrucomicrobiae bacterium]|nr:hypothetical protein [Verrucomicrobiae bacterium]